MRFAWVGMVGAATIVAAIEACGSSSSADVADVPGVDGGSETNADGEVAPDAKVPIGPACVVSPTEKPDVLGENCGVFVAAVGTDSNAGTKDFPLATIGAAVKRAKASGKAWVFVCAGSYVEPTIAVEGGELGVFGKLDCNSGWAIGTTRAKVLGKDPGANVFAFKDVKAKLEGLEIEAKDAVDPGGSSIAVFVNGGSLAVTGGVIKAGNGADGLPGADGGAPMGRADAGSNAFGINGGPLASCVCADGGTTTGGAGGTASAGVMNGSPGSPFLGAGDGGIGGLGSCNPSGLGADGKSGSNGSAGANATAAGLLTVAGWLSGDGQPGLAGPVAQGGGGGGARSGAGGGGGGCGGCGGNAGTGGGGGGASACIASVGAAVACVRSELITGGGGRGGTGGTGQTGQEGGNPGGDLTFTGCNGGKGGNGGSGGNGGGGAGGLSVGILYKGTAPTVDDAGTTFKLGDGGAGGTGGSGPVLNGVSKDKLQVN